MMEQSLQKPNIQEKKSFKQSIFDIYDKKYKLLLIIPFLILFLSLAQISYQIYKTGDFIKRDVSLKGGVTITIPLSTGIDAQQIQMQVSSKFPSNDVVVRTLRSSGAVVGIIVEADINGNDKAQVQSLLQSTQDSLKIDLSKVNYGIEIIGS